MENMRVRLPLRPLQVVATDGLQVLFCKDTASGLPWMRGLGLPWMGQWLAI